MVSSAGRSIEIRLQYYDVSFSYGLPGEPSSHKVPKKIVVSYSSRSISFATLNSLNFLQKDPSYRLVSYAYNRKKSVG